MNPPRCLSLERVHEAAQVIDPTFLNTPQFVSEPLGDALGVRLTLKLETLNPLRSFKGRGADFLVATLKDERPTPHLKTGHLVCASAGNFGQAIAYSARKHGLPLTIYAAENANALKVERMRALGAEVRLQGEDFDAAKLAAKAFAAETGARMLEDSLNPETAEGAGTMGLELLRLAEVPDVLLIPLGNGALINGVALAVKASRPDVQIVAVQAEGAPAMVESWRSGRVVVRERADTIADGIAVRLPVPEALSDMEGLVNDALLVNDDAILRGMRLLHQHVGVVVEPSGAVGVAALLEHPERFRGVHVGTVVCGGNLTLEQMAWWL
jgi:threonine dehydratase